MLATVYRIQIQNSTGVAMTASDTVVIKARRWKFDSSGVRTAESTEATLTAAGTANSLANGGFAQTNTQDNSTLGWIGGEFSLSVNVSTATPNGNVNFYMQQSTDGGTTWPDNGAGELIESIAFTATGTRKRSISY